ncbi:MAG: DEAD/DEAH box helicase [Sulfolobales archaeon]
MSSIIFRINRWLEDEEFRELLKISDYIGWSSGVAEFQFNPAKALKNGYTEDMIFDLLRELNIEISERESHSIRESLQREIEKSVAKIELSYSNGMIVLKPDRYIRNELESIRDLVMYDKNSKVFKTYPIHYPKILSHMKSIGLRVEDKTGFQDRILPVKPRLRVSLRDYQREALEKWIESSYRGIIALPTGSGKTIIGLASVAELGRWTLIVAFTREQLKQWRDHFIKNMGLTRSEVGVFYGEEKIISPITITTYQTAFRHVEKLSPYFPLLIVDECHHLPADKFRKIALHMFSPYRLGLSATPYREDGRHEELFPLLGGVVYSKSAKELAESGYLAPFTIKIVKVGLTPEEMKLYKELKKKYEILSDNLSFQELVARAKKGDQNAIEALKIRSQFRMLVHMAREKIEALRRIVSEELRKGSKIIIFTQYIDQAEEIGRILGAPVITGETEPLVRKRNFEMFRSGEYRFLVITSVGDEGIDIPDANVGIIVAGTGSRRQFIQRLGRLLRPMEGKEAVLYEIIVKDTFEEYESRRRRSALRELNE